MEKQGIPNEEVTSLGQESRCCPLRCRYASEYGLANEIDHTKAVYLRESKIMPELDAWLAQLFNPDRLKGTVATMVDAGAPR
jgi:hypothetical protein